MKTFLICQSTKLLIIVQICLILNNLFGKIKHAVHLRGKSIMYIKWTHQANQIKNIKMFTIKYFFCSGKSRTSVLSYP